MCEYVVWGSLCKSKALLAQTSGNTAAASAAAKRPQQRPAHWQAAHARRGRGPADAAAREPRPATVGAA
eukprot:1388258-Prymnesium_polylepis.1